MPAISRMPQRSLRATTAVAAKTTAAKAVPIWVKSPSSTTVISGTRRAPTSPSAATSSAFQRRATAVAAPAMPAAATSAQASGTNPYIAVAASRVA